MHVVVGAGPGVPLDLQRVVDRMREGHRVAALERLLVRLLTQRGARLLHVLGVPGGERRVEGGCRADRVPERGGGAEQPGGAVVA